MQVFDGETYDPGQDEERLGKQMRAVKRLMLDGAWRTPEEIAVHVPGSVAALTARLRDLRKPKWQSHRVTSRRRAGQGGSWEYQVLPPLPTEPQPVQGALDLGMEG